MRPDPIETAKQALALYYPGSLGAFVGGSVIAGMGSATSDIDIAVLYDNSFNAVHRFSTTLDGWPVEFFVHNETAQDFYFEQDRLKGMCVMPTLVGHGVVIPEEHSHLLDRQKLALEIIRAGPSTLLKSDIELRRYVLTDLLDDLVGASDLGERNATLVRLHNELGDFYLRGKTQWSGVGKALIRKLTEYDPEFSGQFVSTFEAAFSGASLDGLLTLADNILEAHGGRLRDGYRSAAPPTWKTFKRT